MTPGDFTAPKRKHPGGGAVSTNPGRRRAAIRLPPHRPLPFHPCRGTTSGAGGHSCSRMSRAASRRSVPPAGTSRKKSIFAARREVMLFKFQVMLSGTRIRTFFHATAREAAAPGPRKRRLRPAPENRAAAREKAVENPAENPWRNVGKKGGRRSPPPRSVSPPLSTAGTGVFGRFSAPRRKTFFKAPFFSTPCGENGCRRAERSDAQRP